MFRNAGGVVIERIKLKLRGRGGQPAVRRRRGKCATHIQFEAVANETALPRTRVGKISLA
jgi:hypothetical protein